MVYPPGSFLWTIFVGADVGIRPRAEVVFGPYKKDTPDGIPSGVKF